MAAIETSPLSTLAVPLPETYATEVVMILVAVITTFFAFKAYWLLHDRIRLLSNIGARRVLNVLVTLILVSTLILIAKLSGTAFEAAQRHFAKVELEKDAQFAEYRRKLDVIDAADKAIKSAISLHFDKACTFNGYLIDGEWFKTDTHPCIVRGDRRIWRIEKTTRNGTSVEYVSGKVLQNGNVKADLSYSGEYYLRMTYENENIEPLEKISSEISTLFAN